MDIYSLAHLDTMIFQTDVGIMSSCYASGTMYGYPLVMTSEVNSTQ